MAATAQVDAGQHDAARALYERYYPNVYRYALSQVRSPQDAEDAAQNTFLRAFAALQRGIVPENESAWLFKIAHNVCATSRLAWLRRRRVEAPRDLDALPVEPAARELRHDELMGLEDALAAMPARLREAFLLREWQGLSYEEIATRLDTSRSAVETLIFRARRSLAASLQSLGLGPLLNALRALVQGGPVAAKVAAAVVLAGSATLAAKPLMHDAGAPASAGSPRAPIIDTAPAPAARTRAAVARVTAPMSKRRRTKRAAAPPPPAATPSVPSAPAAAAPPAPAAAVVAGVPGLGGTPPALTPPLPETPATPAVPVPQAPQLPTVPPLQTPTLPAAPALPPLP